MDKHQYDRSYLKEREPTLRKIQQFSGVHKSFFLHFCDMMSSIFMSSIFMYSLHVQPTWCRVFLKKQTSSD